LGQGRRPRLPFEPEHYHRHRARERGPSSLRCTVPDVFANKSALPEQGEKHQPPSRPLVFSPRLLTLASSCSSSPLPAEEFITPQLSRRCASSLCSASRRQTAKERPPRHTPRLPSLCPWPSRPQASSQLLSPWNPRLNCCQRSPWRPRCSDIPRETRAEKASPHPPQRERPPFEAGSFFLH
jgi:hypothetical protein